MNQLYDLRDWFYECERFLFLAEVHYHKKGVVPSEHNFSHELTSSCLEKMFGSIRKLAREENCCVNVDLPGCQDDLSFLKEVLDNISSDRWEEMDEKCVLKAQSIVYRMVCAVNSDILENSELRSYPPIYNACKIRGSDDHS
ncbi:hypothetical protein [Methanolobus sp. WCC4]|uniref:hypothetical protein n=1 Tax=Methanolobus sp. WCC4 TaxID=3125784 RepID=UPI0030F82F1C